MKYSDETKSDFVARILKEKGFGTTTVQPAPPRPPIAERTREQIAAEQVERERHYFGHLYLTGRREVAE